MEQGNSGIGLLQRLVCCLDSCDRLVLKRRGFSAAQIKDHIEAVSSIFLKIDVPEYFKVVFGQGV
jgi:hypothetical protein